MGRWVIFLPLKNYFSRNLLAEIMSDSGESKLFKLDSKSKRNFCFKFFSRSHLFTVQQLNPQIHRDSANDIDEFRNLLPSAPPAPTITAATSGGATNQSTAFRRQQNSQIQCPICLCASTLPIETNCGHIFCG